MSFSLALSLSLTLSLSLSLSLFGPVPLLAQVLNTEETNKYQLQAMGSQPRDVCPCSRMHVAALPHGSTKCLMEGRFSNCGPCACASDIEVCATVRLQVTFSWDMALTSACFQPTEWPHFQQAKCLGKIST